MIVVSLLVLAFLVLNAGLELGVLFALRAASTAPNVEPYFLYFVSRGVGEEKSNHDGSGFLFFTRRHLEAVSVGSGEALHAQTSVSIPHGYNYCFNNILFKTMLSSCLHRRARPRLLAGCVSVL